MNSFATCLSSRQARVTLEHPSRRPSPSLSHGIPTPSAPLATPLGNWSQKTFYAAAVLAPSSAFDHRDGTITASSSGQTSTSAQLVSNFSSLKHRTASAGNGITVSTTYAVDPHDEQLYLEIRACEEWRDVLDIISDEGGAMKTKRAVQAAAKLASLMKAMPKKDHLEATSTEAFQNLSSLIHSRLSTMTHSQISATIQALAQLGSPPPLDKLTALSDAFGAQAAKLSARDVASGLHSLSQMGARPSTTVLDRLGYRAHLILKDQNLRQKKQIELGEEHTNTPPSSTENAASTTDSFTPQGISMLLKAVADFGYNNTQLLSSAAAVVTQNIERFSPQAVSNTLTSFSRLDHYYPDLVNASLTFYSKRHMLFKVQEVANIMQALSKLRHHPQATASLLLQPLVDQSSQLMPQDIVQALSMLATFSIAPGKQAISRLCNQLLAMLPRCNTRELCFSLWALALLGETTRPVFSSTAEMLHERFEKGEMQDQSILRQVFQALLCAKMAEAQAKEDQGDLAATAAPRFPPLMLDEMKRSWVSSIQFGVRKASKSTSPTKVVSDLVSLLNVRHDSARPTKDGLVLIDVALQPNDQRYVALQVLRGFDVTRNTEQMLGSVQFERQILEKNGWEVRYLQYEDLLKVEEPARPYFIAEYLKSLGCRVTKAVATPGGPTKAQAASDAAARQRRNSMSVTSEEAREANIVLNDPKANRNNPRRGL